MRNDLEVDQDLHFQSREWRAERIGWLIIASLLLAAALGVFGGHPLAKVTVQTPDGRLSIQYDRYTRYQSNVEFLVTLVPDQDGSGLASLWFDPEYLDNVKVVAVSPVPVRGEAREGGRAFVFQTDGSRFTTSLSVQFETMGWVRGSIWTDQGKPLALSHLVWP